MLKKKSVIYSGIGNFGGKGHEFAEQLLCKKKALEGQEFIFLE